jgi:hypothetical protein
VFCLSWGRKPCSSFLVLLQDAIYKVTGVKLGYTYALGTRPHSGGFPNSRNPHGLHCHEPIMNTWLFVGILQTQVDSFPVTYLKVQVFRYELGSLGYLESSPWKFVHDLEMQFCKYLNSQLGGVFGIYWLNAARFVTSVGYLDGLQDW